MRRGQLAAAALAAEAAVVAVSALTALRQPVGACALGAQRVEREVEWRDVLRRGPDVERRSVGSVTQRVVVGDADPHGGLPRAGLVEGVAQRLGFEVPDTPTARDAHGVVISASPQRFKNCVAAVSATEPISGAVA
jgi:hypothetical protein